MARRADERAHRGSPAMAGNAGIGVLGVCAKTSGAGAGAPAATSAARTGTSAYHLYVLLFRMYGKLLCACASVPLCSAGCALAR